MSSSCAGGPGRARPRRADRISTRTEPGTGLSPGRFFRSLVSAEEGLNGRLDGLGGQEDATFAGRSWGWVIGRVVGPSHISIEPGSAGSKVRGTQAASSVIRRTPKEYS